MATEGVPVACPVCGRDAIRSEELPVTCKVCGWQVELPGTHLGKAYRKKLRMAREAWNRRGAMAEDTPALKRDPFEFPEEHRLRLESKAWLAGHVTLRESDYDIRKQSYRMCPAWFEWAQELKPAGTMLASLNRDEARGLFHGQGPDGYGVYVRLTRGEEDGSTAINAYLLVAGAREHPLREEHECSDNQVAPDSCTAEGYSSTSSPHTEPVSQNSPEGPAQGQRTVGENDLTELWDFAKQVAWSALPITSDDVEGYGPREWEHALSTDQLEDGKREARARFGDMNIADRQLDRVFDSVMRRDKVLIGHRDGTLRDAVLGVMPFKLKQHRVEVLFTKVTMVNVDGSPSLPVGSLPDACSNEQSSEGAENPLPPLPLTEKELTEQLFKAVRCGDCASIPDLIRDGADVNGSDRERWSPLHAAVQSGSQEVVELLVRLGAHVTELRNGMIPWHLALKNKAPQALVKFLGDQAIREKYG